MTILTDFYMNKAPNDEGLYLKDMWSFNDWEMENTHHFIQWMFPLELKSNHNKTAPVVSAEDLKVANTKDFKKNLLTSLNVMENFWGFNVKHQNKLFKRPKNFHDCMECNWMTAYNHNFIRITRVLHSLVIFGLEEEAQELFDYLEKHVYPANKHFIGDDIFNEWKNALNKDLTKVTQVA